MLQRYESEYDARTGRDSMVRCSNGTYILHSDAVAEIERLRKALVEICYRHIPDQPAAYGGDELEWVTRHSIEQRRIAISSLEERK